MEVILKEDFPALGFVGDRVNVKRGYARNYLIPRELAIDASPRNENILRHKLTAISAKRMRLRADAEKAREGISGVVLEFALKTGKEGKVFGAVTAKDIETQLGEKGFAVDRRRIRVPEPLKKAGNYKVEVRLHPEVVLALEVNVKLLLTEPEEKKAEEGKGVKKRRRRGRRREEAGAEQVNDTAAKGEG